ITHEVVHIGEAPGQWTEDETHRENQAKLAGLALARQDEFARVGDQVSASYLGRRAGSGVLKKSASYPETSLEPLLPGQSPEPFPLSPAAELSERYQKAGASVLGEAARAGDGRYAASNGQPLAVAAAEALSALAAAGLRPALRRVVLLTGDAA